ncbi:MAG: hypothetical protein ACOX7I_01495 [Oscillospiraceae bacterium]|jgi:stage III sporulation protein AG
MKTKEVKDIKETAVRLLKNKYMLIVLLLGLVLILLPTGSGDKKDEPARDVRDLEAPAFSLAEEENRLREALMQIKGVGKVKVLLSLKSTATRELAESENKAIIINKGSGNQSAVELRYVYPEYMGAVIICQGASSARVRLDVTRAVSAFTGLSSDQITVIEMNKN